MIVGDFHIHTHFSPDSSTSPEDLVQSAIANGINCIAVTDHDTIEGAQITQSIAPFKVIIGEEISSRDGHIIGLFLSQKVEPGLSLSDTVKAIHNQGGLAIAAHPFSRLARESLQESLFINDNYKLFDAFEIFNSNNFLRIDDKRAQDFTRKKNLIAIAGSDSHHSSGIGSNKVFMDDFSCPQSFLESLKLASIKNRVHPFRYFSQHLLHMATLHLQVHMSKYHAVNN